MEQSNSLGLMNDKLLGFLEEEFKISKLNRLPEKYGGGNIFSHPLVGVAQGNDPIFHKFKKIIGQKHLTPLEMWIASGQDQLSASDLYVVSVVFPFVDKIRKESNNPIVLPKITLPAEIYSVARNYGNEFKRYIIKQTINFFKEKSYNAISGMFSDSYSIVLKGGYYSTWSERYIAFATGLGTFSLHEGLITEVGCNIRLASVVTNAPIKISRRKSDEPYANCLYYAKGICKECINKCPANAITVKGHNKVKCNKYRMKVARKMVPRLGSILKPDSRRINWKLKEDIFVVGCEFCQFGVPCTEKNPMLSYDMDFF